MLVTKLGATDVAARFWWGNGVFMVCEDGAGNTLFETKRAETKDNKLAFQGEFTIPYGTPNPKHTA